MSGRTLVITLGQLRAHHLSWLNFKENLLDQIQADLAVCAPLDGSFDVTSPFYLNARYRWLVPDVPDFAVVFDQIQRVLGANEDWRVLCDVPGAWLGRIAQSGQPTATSILFVLRWFMLNNIQAARLTEIYDRFIITRTDFFYLSPHPPLVMLDPNCLWIPDGEDHGGFCDRHLVVSAGDLAASCGLIDDLLLHPDQLRAEMLKYNYYWNIESFLGFHFRRKGLMDRVRRFPYVMFLVRGSDEPTLWTAEAFASGTGVSVKYPNELYNALLYQHVLRSTDDWRNYFGANERPARMRTQLGTVCYVDETDGVLRHGPAETSPDNVVLLSVEGNIRIRHVGREGIHDIVRLPDQSLISARWDEQHPHPSPPSFTMFSAEHHGVFGFQADGKFLALEYDGRIMLSQPDFSYLESYFALVVNKEAKIYTTFGTVLYVEEVTGELRHGPVAEVPKNIMFLSDFEKGRILYIDDGTYRDLAYLHDGRVSLRSKDADAKGPAMLNMTTPRHNALTKLTWENLCLCALPDGGVVMRSSALPVHEHFYLIAWPGQP